MRRGAAFACALAIAALAPDARAVAARPNFAGTWTLDVKRSAFGKIIGTTPPSARTDVIAHADPALRDSVILTRSGDTSRTTFDYVIDGQERTMKVGGQTAEYTGAWSGDTLRLDSRVRMLVFEISVRERWTLSRDGRALTVARHVESPLGKGDQVLRFRRAGRR